MKRYILTFIAAITTLTATSYATTNENWITDSATGCRLWNPNPNPNESIVWFGSITDGKAEGYGIAIWKINGKETERAAGEWKNGRLNGGALWTHTSGTSYAGEWKDGKKNGYGVYKWPDGTSFLGKYANDQRIIGRTVDKNGKKRIPIEPTPIRQACYRAQDAAIAAIKAATIADAKNHKQIVDSGTPPQSPVKTSAPAKAADK